MAQIATITVETAGGPVDLPVYEPGDSGSNRLEAFRVQTASGPGFVPLAAVDEADRPYLRVQTSSGVRAVDTSASGIPDSGDYQWYVDEGSGTTLNADVGGISQSIVSATWQSLASAVGDYYLQLDGSDDRTESDSTITLSDPFTVFGWIRPQSWAFSGFEGNVWANSDYATGTGSAVAPGGNTATLSTGSGDGATISPHLENVSFVGNGSWGFFALLRDGTEHRLITFDNSQELADSSASQAEGSATPTDTLLWGDGRDGHLQMDLDFHGFANSLLTKSEVTDLWQSTQR